MAEYTNLGVGSNILALSQLVRGGNPMSLVDEILAKGDKTEIADLFILLFVVRNCRGGKERRSFLMISSYESGIRTPTRHVFYSSFFLTTVTGRIFCI